MRRENRRRQIDEGLDGKKILYITGSVLALAVIAFVITFLIYGNNANDELEISKSKDNEIIGNLMPVEETSTSYGKTVNEVEEENSQNEENEKETETETEKIAINTSQIEETNTTNNNVNTTNKTEETNKETQTTKGPEKVEDPGFKKPVEGEVIKDFADNKLVYSSTLDVWTTHNGIDIKADETTVVKASAEGTVSSIKNDPRYGLTVIVEHVNGYKTVYANLLSTEFVVEGEEVKQGQSLGTVGSTASFEILDEPHLHFELLKDNKQLDPELYLK